MFVEITNIDGIMGQSALEAVECMNAVFSCLDNVIDQHSVYKVLIYMWRATFRLYLTNKTSVKQVETVGKVYVVVGGAPDRNETHVRDVSIGTV